MRLAPDWNAWPVPGHARLATASNAGFWPSGNRAAMRITSSAPGRSKSTISVEQRPVMTNSSASCWDGQLTKSISSSWRVALKVGRVLLSWHRTAAEWRMSNKVRVAARRVNVTAVILGVVTKALYKPWKMQALSGARRWRFCFASLKVRGRNGFAKFAEHTLRTEVQTARPSRSLTGAPTQRTAIMKNCAHDYEATDSIYNSFVGATQREGCSRWRAPSRAGRVGDQTHR